MLKKIILEKFSKEITDITEKGRCGNYINKIVSELEGYISKRGGSGGPGESFIYVGEIPSIPGGFLEIIEVNRAFTVPYIERIEVRFEHLEDVPLEDLEQVRNVFRKYGLEKGVG